MARVTPNLATQRGQRISTKGSSRTIKIESTAAICAARLRQELGISRGNLPVMKDLLLLAGKLDETLRLGEARGVPARVPATARPVTPPASAVSSPAAGETAPGAQDSSRLLLEEGGEEEGDPKPQSDAERDVPSKPLEPVLFTHSFLHESTPSSAAGAAAEMEEAPAGAGSGPAEVQAEVAEEAPVGVPCPFHATLHPSPGGDEANSSPQKHGAVALQDRSGEAAQGGRLPRPVGGGEDAADAEGQRQSSGAERRAGGGEVRREPYKRCTPPFPPCTWPSPLAPSLSVLPTPDASPRGAIQEGDEPPSFDCWNMRQSAPSPPSDGAWRTPPPVFLNTTPSLSCAPPRSHSRGPLGPTAHTLL